MTDGLRANVDFEGVKEALTRLDAALQESLARRMAVSGARIIRNEARLRAPNGGANFSANPGLLKSAMYVVFNQTLSSGTAKTYSVSWNRKKAPHGHLVEFGHWQPYIYKRFPDGSYRTIEGRLLPGKGHRVPATPFLRPALEAKKYAAVAAAIETGKRELPALLREVGK